MTKKLRSVISFTLAIGLLWNMNSCSGLSTDILATSDYESSSTSFRETSDGSMPFKENIVECEDRTISHELLNECNPSNAPSVDVKALEGESGDVELSNFFSEDAEKDEALPSSVLELQRRERMNELLSGKNLEKLEGIWKKVIVDSLSFMKFFI